MCVSHATRGIEDSFGTPFIIPFLLEDSLAHIWQRVLEMAKLITPLEYNSRPVVIKEDQIKMTLFFDQNLREK